MKIPDSEKCPRCDGTGRRKPLSNRGRKPVIDLKIARRMRDAGKTLQEIAERFGVSRQSVHEALQTPKKSAASSFDVE